METFALCVALLCLVCLIAGAWLLHARLRNRYSLAFALAFSAMVAWAPVSFALLMNVVMAGRLQTNLPPTADQAALLIGITAVKVLLLVATGASFVLAARSIPRRRVDTGQGPSNG